LGARVQTVFFAMSERMMVPVWYKEDKFLHRLVYGFFRFGALNIVAELIAFDTSTSHESGVKRYMDLMQLLGLIAALLLSLSIAPLTALGAWGAADTDASKGAVSALLLVFFLSAVNLIMVSFNTVFCLAFKNKNHAYHAIVNYPVFGVPILASIMSFVCLLWWFVSYVFLVLPAAFFWALVGLCAFFVAAGVPIWGALFAFLLKEAKAEPAAAAPPHHGE
jgi:hypothetical protein